MDYLIGFAIGVAITGAMFVDFADKLAVKMTQCLIDDLIGQAELNEILKNKLDWEEKRR